MMGEPLENQLICQWSEPSPVWPESPENHIQQHVIVSASALYAGVIVGLHGLNNSLATLNAGMKQ